VPNFKIHQINIRQHHDAINSKGWEGASREIPAVLAYLETSTRGASGFKPEHFHEFEHVATIRAADLDQAYFASNIGLEANITRIQAMHSLSVGDIVETETGHLFMVDAIGFSEVHKPRPRQESRP
jgi:hypothetical protein